MNMKHLILFLMMILTLLLNSCISDIIPKDSEDEIITKKIKNNSNYNIFFTINVNDNNIDPLKDETTIKINKNDSLEVLWKNKNGDNVINSVKIYFNDSCFIKYNLNDKINSIVFNSFFDEKNFKLDNFSSHIIVYTITDKDYEYWLKNKICE